jgi:steroid delta-isomerase-like uncharacterized protein
MVFLLAHFGLPKQAVYTKLFTLSILTMRKENIFLTMSIALVLVVITGCAPKMSKDTIRRNVDTIWNKGDVKLVDELYSPDFVLHRPGQEDLKGPEAYKQNILSIRKSFPDLQFTIEDIVIEGDKGAASWSIRGTNKGTFKSLGREIPATGKQVTVSGMSIWRVKDGKVVEEFAIHDSLGMMQQLGLIPR